MGLFGKLFEKKECSICGGEIGLLGNRKLEDGNCCKTCTKKLSPWFDDRRHSTIEQIKAQLAYRAENEKQLESFKVSRVIGEDYKIYIEEGNGIPTRFFVTDAKDYMTANPDIVSFKNVLGCTTDIRSREEELKQRDSNGNMVSYNPPRYKVHHDFYILMQIGNTPWFDDMKFKLNGAVITLEVIGTRSPFGGLFGNSTTTTGGFGNIRAKERYHEFEMMCQQVEQAVADSKIAPQAAPVASAAPAPVVPAGPKFCSSCGSPADGGKFCQNCGAPL